MVSTCRWSPGRATCQGESLSGCGHMWHPHAKVGKGRGERPGVQRLTQTSGRRASQSEAQGPCPGDVREPDAAPAGPAP